MRHINFISPFDFRNPVIRILVQGHHVRYDMKEPYEQGLIIAAAKWLRFGRQGLLDFDLNKFETLIFDLNDN